MRQSTGKGLYHAILSIAAVAEAFTAETRTRKVLLGACCGWHLWSTYDHFVNEPKRDIYQELLEGIQAMKERHNGYLGNLRTTNVGNKVLPRKKKRKIISS